MRTKHVLRYYCDHCGKGGLKKGSMADHELACIKNPTRAHCWLCAQVPQDTTPMDILKASFSNGDVELLRVATNGCPACMLAAIVQTTDPFATEEENWTKFNYREEKIKFLDALIPKHSLDF